MGEFFRGWGRKLGLLTLAMAVLLMAGWVRSQYVLDIFSFPTVPSFSEGIGSGTLILFQRGILWLPAAKANGIRRRMYPHWKTFDSSNSFAQSLTSELNETLDSPRIRWRFKWHGIVYGELIDDLGNLGIWHVLIPYWSIVIPLTLLSAYLLLVKPKIIGDTEFPMGKFSTRWAKHSR